MARCSNGSLLEEKPLKTSMCSLYVRFREAFACVDRVQVPRTGACLLEFPTCDEEAAAEGQAERERRPFRDLCGSKQLASARNNVESPLGHVLVGPKWTKPKVVIMYVYHIKHIK